LLGTYALAVSTTGTWAASAVLFAQIVTVELALRTSQTRRSARIAAAVVLVVAGAGAVVNLFVDGELQSLWAAGPSRDGRWVVAEERKLLAVLRETRRRARRARKAEARTLAKAA